MIFHAQVVTIAIEVILSQSLCEEVSWIELRADVTYSYREITNVVPHLEVSCIECRVR